MANVKTPFDEPDLDSRSLFLYDPSSRAIDDHHCKKLARSPSLRLLFLFFSSFSLPPSSPPSLTLSLSLSFKNSCATDVHTRPWNTWTWITRSEETFLCRYAKRVGSQHRASLSLCIRNFSEDCQDIGRRTTMANKKKRQGQRRSCRWNCVAYFSLRRIIFVKYLVPFHTDLKSLFFFFPLQILEANENKFHRRLDGSFDAWENRGRKEKCTYRHTFKYLHFWITQLDVARKMLRKVIR